MTGSREKTRPRRDGRHGWQKLADWLGDALASAVGIAGSLLRWVFDRMPWM